MRSLASGVVSGSAIAERRSLHLSNGTRSASYSFSRHPAMARKSTLPSRLQPMLATLTDAPFDDPNWIFEDKFDGFRMVSEIRGGRVALYSRTGKSSATPMPRSLKHLRG